MAKCCLTVGFREGDATRREVGSRHELHSATHQTAVLDHYKARTHQWAELAAEGATSFALNLPLLHRRLTKENSSINMQWLQE